MKSAEIVVPKPTSYKLPEGRFKAKIARVVVKPAKGSRERSPEAHNNRGNAPVEGDAAGAAARRDRVALADCLRDGTF